MKKTIFAFAATLILFATTSCKKNKDNVTIQGKWFLKTEYDQEYKNGTLNDTSTYAYEGSPYFEFLDNGTLNVKDEDGNVSAGTYTYIEDTKKMTLTDDEDSYEFDVTKLTSSDLTLHSEETYPFDGDTYKYITDLYLKR